MSNLEEKLNELSQGSIDPEQFERWFTTYSDAVAKKRGLYCKTCGALKRLTLAGGYFWCPKGCDRAAQLMMAGMSSVPTEFFA